jgi:hypothetical protein
MANDVATQKTASELLSQAAEELNGCNLGKILKFSKGKYFVGEDEIKPGTEFIAHATQLARGWVKFKGAELVDRRIGKVIDGFVAPQREELDDTDQSAWEKNERGEPRDPWISQSYLPFENAETGELLVFVSGSAGGRGAIGSLVSTASRNLHKGKPIIQLGLRWYKHKTFGRIENPDFPIVGWTDGIAAISAVSAAPTPTLPAKAVHPAFDDTIPY